MGGHSNKKYAEKVAGLPQPKNHWPKWIVSGGGLGLLRPAPGSWGTLGPAAIYYLCLLNGGAGNLGVMSVGMVAGAIITGALLVHFGKWACAYWRKIDPGQVVLDEYAGFFITAAFVPVPAALAADWLHLGYWVGGLYVLFRLTDTLKLPPGKQLEGLPWGWGILLDDVAAGVQANIVAQIVARTAFA